jgi:hypothetical protein
LCFSTIRLLPLQPTSDLLQVAERASVAYPLMDIDDRLVVGIIILVLAIIACGGTIWMMRRL